MPELSARIVHKVGAFSLDVAFKFERWPVVLFGPSGSGKTTVLRILAGLVRPVAGRIAFDERVLIDTASGMSVRPGTKRIQLVTQRAALFPHLTVRENVAFGLARKERRGKPALELLRLLRIEGLAERLPGKLSGGEARRVALARALARDPQLLLLDEAFVGLDHGMKQEILGDLQQVATQQSISIVYVTHEVSDAYALNANVVRIHDGRMIAQGDTREILAEERERLLQLLQ